MFLDGVYLEKIGGAAVTPNFVIVEDNGKGVERC